VFYGIVSLILIALILTFMIRYQYTDKTRDLRFWNRRRFANMGGPPTIPTCEAIQGLPAEIMKGIKSAENTIKDTAGSAAAVVTDARGAANEQLFG
jgi:hypothetical protein